jgi:hypothetical protein
MGEQIVRHIASRKRSGIKKITIKNVLIQTTKKKSKNIYINNFLI